MKYEIFGLIISFAFGVFVHGEENKDNLIDEFYVKSGFEAQVKNLPESFKLTLGEHSYYIDKSQGVLKEYFENVNGLLYKSFDSTVLGSAIKEDLRRDLSVDQINHMLNFLNTPTGKKTTELEVRASSTEGITAFNNYLAAASAGTIPLQRQAQLAKLEKLLHTLDYTTEMNINIQLAVTSALAFTISTDRMLEFEEIVKGLNELKPAMKQDLEPLVDHFLYFTYKDLSDKELTELITFYESDTSQHLIKAISDAYLKAVTTASYSFSRGVLDFFTNHINKEAA